MGRPPLNPWVLWSFTSLVVVLCLWYASTRYHECRRHGFSVWYCVGQ